VARLLILCPGPATMSSFVHGGAINWSRKVWARRNTGVGTRSSIKQGSITLRSVAGPTMMSTTPRCWSTMNWMMLVHERCWSALSLFIPLEPRSRSTFFLPLNELCRPQFSPALHMLFHLSFLIIIWILTLLLSFLIRILRVVFSFSYLNPV